MQRLHSKLINQSAPRKTYEPVNTRDITATENDIIRNDVIRLVQREDFSQYLIGTMPKKGPLHKLSSFIDSEGILRLGGRLSRACMLDSTKHPVLMPKDHHVSNLIMQQHHQNTAHQGRGITVNALRTGGYWVIGANSAVSRLISNV